MFGISDTLLPYLSSAAQLQHLDAIARTGARWVRVDFSWAAIQSQGPTRFNWAPWDAIVRAATARGLHVLGVVAYTPQWALPTSVNLATPGSYLNPPAHPRAYGTFAGQLAARYGRMGVHAWEIWNEPNIRAFFRPQPNPVTYTAMLKSAYVSIKHNDPGATVVAGGIAPCNSTNGIIATQWLRDLYADGAGGYSKYNYEATFVGMVPASHPQLVVLVKVDDPRGSIFGGVVAAPAFAQIAKFDLQYLSIPPDESRTALSASTG